MKRNAEQLEHGTLGTLGLGQDSTQVSSKKMKNFKGRNFHCRLSAWTEEDFKVLHNYGLESGGKFILCKEVGKDNNPHLHFAIFLQRPISANTIKNLIVHERANDWMVFKAKGDMESNHKYCSKEGDFVTNMTADDLLKKHGGSRGYTNLRAVEAEILHAQQEKTKQLELKKMEDIKWLGWQRNIMDIIAATPSERNIYWFWEDNGNSGKSTLLRYLFCSNEDIICGDGKMADVFFVLKRKVIKNGEDVRTYAILLDIPRTSEEHVNYGMLERLKNGMILAGKFESEQLIIPKPHLIVMANFEPDRTKMSADRWQITKINEWPVHNAPDLTDEEMKSCLL